MLEYFPNVKNCYEKRINEKPKKYDVCLAIPKGNKYYGWFTYLNKDPVFCIIDINKTKIYYKYTSFDKSLCNTIVYGTQLYYKSNEIYCIEDILFFKSKKVYYLNLKEKIKLIEIIFKNLHREQINKSFLIFGFPMNSTNYDSLVNENKPYITYCYQFRNLNTFEPYLNYHPDKKQNNIKTIFRVVAEDKQDIYKLYCKDGFYSYANVSSIAVSKKLNNIFRDIKETNNLDLLEESEDEETFENISNNKYNLNQTKYMICKYIPSFKQWEPQSITTKNFLLTNKEIKNLEII